MTDHRNIPQPGLTVVVKNDMGRTGEGVTGGNGKVTVPPVTTGAESVCHSAYIVGYPDGTFGPANNMTRSEAAAIFARILAARKGDSITPSAATMFTDIPAGVWYSGYVNYLSGYGIVNGRGNNLFAPDAPVTRAEFTAMAVRFFAVYGDGNAEIMEQYKDFNDVTPGYWASQYIEDAARHGWVLGYGNGSFGPENNITRSEVVTLVNRLLDRDADLDFIKANLRTLVTFPDVAEGTWYYGAVMEAANNHTAKMGDAEIWSR